MPLGTGDSPIFLVCLSNRVHAPGEMSDSAALFNPPPPPSDLEELIMRLPSRCQDIRTLVDRDLDWVDLEVKQIPFCHELMGLAASFSNRVVRPYPVCPVLKKMNTSCHDREFSE